MLNVLKNIMGDSTNRMKGDPPVTTTNAEDLMMWVEVRKTMIHVPVEFRSDHFILLLHEIEGYIFELTQYSLHDETK